MTRIRGSTATRGILTGLVVAALALLVLDIVLVLDALGDLFHFTVAALSFFTMG